MSWPKVKLGDCCEIVSGATPKTGNPDYWGGGIPWVSPKSLSKLETKYLNEPTEYITQAGFDSCSTRMLPPMSLLLSCRAPVGLTAINRKPICTNQGFKSLIPNSEMLDINYLFYVMRKMRPILEAQGRGATFTEVSKSIVERFEIPLPPLDEQRRIAAILDKAHSIERTSSSIQKIRDDLLHSIFISMFGDPGSNPMGWEKVKLNQLCSFDKKSVKPENIPDGTNYLGLECIEKKTGNILDIMTVMNGELKSNKFQFDESYILYGKLRPYLNKVALPRFDGICSTDIIPIQPILSETNKIFISYILKNECFVSFAHERSSGANLPRISPKEVQSFLTIKPPFSLQNRFAEIVNIVKSIPDAKKKYSANLASITQEIFT